ncbi:EAL and HDOD domain-containing protein [Paraburkholderia sp.]|uniref:EAL and HDOD domain-containing protein n=1 Tax=Paraburkholderia sp. TaxID=1926495 RepID=UPI003D6FEFB0
MSDSSKTGVSSDRARRPVASRTPVDDARPPTPAALAAGVQQCVYLGRQPIVDRHGAVSAYELLFRAGPQNRADVSDDAQATAQVVVRTIGGIGVAAVLGTRRGYVNIGRELLFDDIVHLMSPERFVLEILETVTFDARLLARIADLRRAGFGIALDDVCAWTDNIAVALPHADIVKIDFLQTPRDALPELVERMRGAGRTLIAEKVETREDFALGHALGFDLFQGYFFARPQMLAAPRARISRPALLRLLALLARDADIAELEAELKLSPPIVVQLLRLVNSSAFGLARDIGSLREAVLVAGTRQIARWAQLLLYAGGSELPWHCDPLVQLAGTRSRFMELVARELRPNDEAFVDAAIMTAIFSLVHVVLGGTIEQALGRFGLAQPIRDAIVGYRGPLGAVLRIAEAADHGDDAMALAHDDALAGFAPLTSDALAELNLAAAAWFDAHAAE